MEVAVKHGGGQQAAGKWALLLLRFTSQKTDPKDYLKPGNGQLLAYARL